MKRTPSTREYADALRHLVRSTLAVTGNTAEHFEQSALKAEGYLVGIVQKVLKGEEKPSFQLYRGVARYFGIPLSALFTTLETVIVRTNESVVSVTHGLAQGLLEANSEN